MKQKQNPVWWLIILLSIIKFALPFLLQSSVYELQRDEFLYYLQGQHPALGYLENPPLLSYLGMISSWLGGSVFWIKCWPAFFGALTLIITCMITAELGGKTLAQLMAGIAVTLGALLRMSALFQPNALDVFFWTLSIYFLIRFLGSQRTGHLYAFTISLALGFWGKYSIAFVAASLILALILTRHRKIFLQKRIYVAFIIAVIIILPNVYWQYTHNWPLFHHMHELRETQLKYLDPNDFIKDQFLMTLPVIYIWIAGLIWAFRNKAMRFLGFTYLFVIILLMLGSGKSYYSMGIYPALFAAGSVAWEQWTEKSKWIMPFLLSISVMFTCLILPAILPVWEPAQLATFYKRHDIKNKWEDQHEHSLPQDFADMLGWKELSLKTESFYNKLPDSVKGNTVIYCRNYGQAGALQYYGMNADFRNKIISDNGSFLLWIPSGLQFKNIVLVGHDIPDADDELFQHFGKYTVADSVTDIYSRQLGDKIIFFQHADDKASKLAQEGLAEKKKVFRR